MTAVQLKLAKASQVLHGRLLKTWHDAGTAAEIIIIIIIIIQPPKRPRGPLTMNKIDIEKEIRIVSTISYCMIMQSFQ